MTKISVYNIDEYVTADDKWIGTDVNTYNKTKNFTPRKLSHYFNNNQVINTGVDLLYKYFTITPPETRPTGTLSFETEIGPTVNFSAISTFLLSKTTLKGNYIVEFFDFLVGTNVLLYKAKNINLFGSYNIVSVEEYLPEPNFFVVNVEFIEGNGFIEEDEDYMISLIDISGGGGDSPITIENNGSLFSTGLVGTGVGSDANFSTFFGLNTGFEATGANNSIFIGQLAGSEATIARDSIFMGWGAGQDTTDASYSNFFGNAAGNAATDANYSNFFGVGAGFEAINVSGSNFFGSGAGGNTSGASYSNLFGYEVGRANILGSIGSNNIIIGTSISLPTGATNSINIGGVLFGTNTNELGEVPSIIPSQTGKIGIGVVEPTNTLHIYSEAANTSGLRLERLTSTSPTSTGQAIGVDASGNVVTVTGGGGGSQDLQSVTDIGATTDNTITINTIDANGLNINTSGGDTTKSAMVLTSTIPDGFAFKSYSYNGSVANYFYSDLGDCISLQNDYANGAGIIISSAGTGISAYSIAYPVVELYQALTNKGLVINSGTSSTGNFIELAKNSVNKLTVNQAGELTAQKLIKEGGFDYQFLKADGSVDNNTYLTSADLPSTLDLYATTSPDPVIAGYTALVRNIADSRYNTVAFDVPTPLVNGTLAAPTLCGVVISDPSVLLGNPGVFNFTVIGNIRRVSGSTSSGADFFYKIYKRDISGTEVFISESAKVPVPANGGFYIEYISTALWNNGIFLSTDRIVLKFYGIQTGGGTGAYYEFLFGGSDPVRGTAAISSAIIPNIYLRDLADVEKVPAENNEILYWNDPASLWEHELAENLVPLATATQKGLVSTTTQTFAGDKTFTGIITSGTVFAFSVDDYGVNAISTNSDAISAESSDGNGIVAISQSATGGIFMTTNGANIAEFRTNFVEKAKIDSDGLITGTGLNASGQTINTIASFDGSKNVVSLPTATYPSLTELALVKGVSGSSIQTQLDSKVDENTAITGATKTKITYDSKGLVTAGADIATTDISDFNSATRAQVEAELVAGTNITITPAGTGGTRTLTIASTGGGSSTLSPFTMLANNSDVNAIPTQQIYKDIAEQTYSLTPVWVGTAPTTIVGNTYQWQQVGSLVTVRVNLIYATAGSITRVFIPLPNDMPTPFVTTELSTASAILYYGAGMFNSLSTSISTVNRVCYLAKNATNTGFEFAIIHSTAVSSRVISLTLQYFT